MRYLKFIALLLAFVCVTNVILAKNSNDDNENEDSTNDQDQWDASTFFYLIYTIYHKIIPYSSFKSI